jgi:hypothetical protein
MKRLFTLFTALLFISLKLEAQTSQKIVGDSTGTSGQYIFKNRTLTNDKIWLLEDIVYVQNGATLTIQPGALIKGSGKGTIVIARGAKIIADGKRNQPIIFTSLQPVGKRAQGDWGGIVILGKAVTNGSYKNIKGQQEIEGGINDAADNGVHGGGANPDPNDNSGILRYVRLEYGGFQFSPNNEINGLTLGSVGKGTTLEYIQVSFANDDAYEWFGGNVNAKYLVSYGNIDDDFDTDNGYIGNVQFGLVLRDPTRFDGAGDSNGFESDNNSGGTYVPPYTAANFSNITVVGPKTTTTTTVSSFFNHAARIRRNSRIGIFNSILMGFRNAGYRMESTATAKVAKDDSTALLLNTIIPTGSNSVVASSDSAANANLPTGGILAYLTNSARANDTTKTVADLKLADPFNLTAPRPIPTTGSPVLTGAAFTNARLQDAFFDKTITFRGAFGTTNWMESWTNFRPDTSAYNAPITASLGDLTEKGFKASIYPNPTQGNFLLEFSLEKSMNVEVQILDMLGRNVKTIRNQRFTEGVNQLPIDLNLVSKGLYMVRFISYEYNAQKTIPLNVIK